MNLSCFYHDPKLNAVVIITPLDIEKNMIDLIDKFAKKYSIDSKSIFEYTIEDVPIWIDATTFRNKHSIPGKKFIIVLKIPKLEHEGYTWIGTLEKVALDDGTVENMVFSRDPTKNLSHYFDSEFGCDHCHTKIATRKKVHIFTDKDNNEKMFASKCVAEYFGTDMANQLMKLIRMGSDIFNDMEEEFNGCCRGINVLDKETFLKLTYSIIKKCGYISMKKASESEDKYPTVTEVGASMTEPWGCQEKDIIAWKNKREEYLKLAESFDIDKFNDYYTSMNGADDEFIHNMKLNVQMCNPKQGLLVYQVFKYMKEVEHCFDNQVKIDFSKSVFVAEVGKRIEITGKVFSVHKIESEYGVTQIVNIIGTDNNLFTWFNNSSTDMELNHSYTLKGTIKKHEEYKGNKVTYIFRCKILKEIEADK